MKFRQFKNNLKTEEYNIPNVLNKIKDNLPEVRFYPKSNYKLKLKYRYAIGFLSMLVLLLFMFSVSTPITYNQASGPTQISYFSNNAEISNTLKKFNQEKETYVNKSQKIYENYMMDNIKVSKIYDSNNQTALVFNNYIYYLNDTGFVVLDPISGTEFVIFQENLDYDNVTNVKTMYIEGDNLVIIYNNSKSLNILKYNVKTLNLEFTYSIRSTYINSHVFNGNLFLVSILNEAILPDIRANGEKKVKEATDIGYLENVVGESYTILTTINLNTNQQNETIFLSFNKWDVVYFYGNSLYLINTHMNYKKDLNYGEYTTVLKFKNVAKKGYEYYGFNYHGSYTIKGSIKDKNNVYAIQNDLRLTLEVTHYKLKKVFFFFTKVTEIEQSIEIINLSETTIENNPILELTSNTTIRPDTIKGDSTISIVSTVFYPNRVLIESRSTDSLITVLDFVNPLNIRTNSYLRNRVFYSNIIPLNQDYGFNLRTIKTATGEFEIKFFNLTEEMPQEEKVHYINLNYSDYLDNGNYIILDSIKFSNSLFLDQSNDFYYIGFNTTNNLKTNGTYTIISIDKNSYDFKIQHLDNNPRIEKLVGFNDDLLIGLANDTVIGFTLNSLNEFEEVFTTKMP